MKRLLVGFLITCFLFFPPVTFASHKLTISSDKASLSPDEQATVTLQFSGFDLGETLYVKGAFFIEGSSNYFGLSKNGDSWIKNSASVTSQPGVTLSSSDPLLTIKSDSSDSGFHGEGDYKLKVGYYYTTSGGNVSSVNWSDNILSMHLSSPPTNTPTPSPTPTNTPTPTTPQVSHIATSAQSDESLVGREGEEITQIPETDVLAEETFAAPSPTETPVPIQINGVSTSTQVSLFPILLGFGILCVCAILICRKLWGWKLPFEQ
jgi:hypothetical protein